MFNTQDHKIFDQRAENAKKKMTKDYIPNILFKIEINVTIGK